MNKQIKKYIMAALIACAANTANSQDIEPQPAPNDQKKGEPILKDVANSGIAKNDYAHMELQFNSSGHVLFEDGKYSNGNFTLNGMKMQISGNLSDRLGYTFRQSFTKRYDLNSLDKVSLSVEKAFVTWDVSKVLQLSIGKQYLELGGYEYWVSSNRVRFYSDFNSTIRCGQMGAGGYLRLSPDHTVALQLLNNSCASETDIYPYGYPADRKQTKTPVIGVLGYKGYFADRALSLHYGAGYGQLARDRQQLYLTAGHVWERGPVLAYLDMMYAREGIDTKGIISGYSKNYAQEDDDESNRVCRTAQHVEYLSAIANIDYRINRRFNTYVKGIMETGRVYRANGIYTQGRYNKTWSLQGCVEYFPIEDRDLRLFLHGAYKRVDTTQLARQIGTPDSETLKISIGLEYVLPVF